MRAAQSGRFVAGFFVGLRFRTAALLGAVLFRWSLRSVSRLDLPAGVSIGVTLHLRYGQRR
ncbi:hypothetical protein ACFC09_42535 [Streptomyces sp. NPDC056161]|uniref:hypothetical protein n=1 Tax=Streptomyces sp. NPDC056161 TaxID=3345732 RepID=UPI0035D6722A